MKEAQRIFIAIPLPKETGKYIADALGRWRWLSVRWIPEERWHISVIPPFSVLASEISAVQRVIQSIAEKTKPFSITFDAVRFAPEGVTARMVWVVGPAFQRLQGLREEIEREFVFNKTPSLFRRPKQKLTPHVTVARFQEGELRGLEEKTNTLQKIDISFPINEIAVLKSLPVSSAEYEILALSHMAGTR